MDKNPILRVLDTGSGSGLGKVLKATSSIADVLIKVGKAVPIVRAGIEIVAELFGVRTLDEGQQRHTELMELVNSVSQDVRTGFDQMDAALLKVSRRKCILRV